MRVWGIESNVWMPYFRLLDETRNVEGGQLCTDITGIVSWIEGLEARETKTLPWLISSFLDEG